MKTKSFLILTLLGWLSVATAMAQELIVKGLVTDNAQEPLVGIIVKSKIQSVVTNANGRFEVKANENDVLTFSGIGYVTATRKVNSTNEMTVVLAEKNENIDEVIVVGTAMKRSDLTGSLSTVNSQTLNQKPATSINEALQGRVAGVFITPGQSPSDGAGIKIRGTNTINSGSNPIYVVDGMVMSDAFNFFNSINPNDVEEIQVLKDASATALYGSRGANGVVVITTKKAKQGKGQISYDGWIGVTTMGHRPATMNTQQLYDLRLEAFANGYMYNNPTADRQSYIDNVLLKNNMAFAEEELAGYNSGKTYNWLDRVSQTGIKQNHTLSFSKATEGTNLYVSLNTTNTKGVILNTHQKSYTGRVNADASINQWVKIGTNTSFTYTEDNVPSDNVFNKSLWANPMIDYAPYEADATRHLKDYRTLYWRAHTEQNNNDFNPFNSLEISQDRQRNYLTSVNYININPFKGFNIRSTFSLNHTTQAWFEYIPTGIQETERNNNGDAFSKHERWSTTTWQWDNSLSYVTMWDKHRLNAILGTSTSRTINNYTLAGGSRFASNDLTYHKLSGAANLEKRLIDSDFANSSLVSFISRVNYDYDNRYFATFTARYDGSSKFGTGHKWGLMPSFSLAWNMAGEQFMQPYSSWLNKLKIRAGYGVTGNQDIENYAYLTLYYPQISNGVASYRTSGRRGTPGITWEKQRQTNFGLDIAMWNNRLSMSVDAFFITNDDLLMNHSLNRTSGYTNTWENIGTMTNRGLEFTVNATPIQTKDWQWNVGANLSLDRNKITRLYGGVKEILNDTYREGNIFLNKPLHTIYTYRTGGIANESNRSQWENVNYNGKTVALGDLFPADINNDKVIDQKDREIVGTTTPKFYGGFSTDITWKGLTLNTVFNYSVGAKRISSYYESLINSTGVSSASTDLLDRWTPQNTGAKFPRVIDNVTLFNRVSPSDLDFSIQNASYLRLSTLSLSYQVPRSILSSIKVNSLKVYFTASNLFCITPYKGFDPELGDSKYPPTKMFVFGLNFSL